MAVPEALRDLIERLNKAESRLFEEAISTPGPDAIRLDGKAQGVALARDYLRHTLTMIEES